MRARGGFIGANVTPASAAFNSAASGVWTVREAEALKRAATWPSAPTVPGTPTSLSASGGNAQASLTWTAPASNGGTAITDYAVQFSSDSGSTWTTFADGTSTATSATVTGLTNGVAYVFRVAAVNAIGAGPYTSASSSVTPAAPSFSTTLASGGGANSWRWLTGGYTDSQVWIGRGDDGTTVQSTGWRTTFTPASKPSAIASATFTFPYTWATDPTAFTVVLRGAQLVNAGQGLQGTSPTTASATASVTTSNGTLTFDCTAVIAEIIGQSGWTPGNSIVLYLFGDNAGTDRVINTIDTAGSLVINYS